MSRPRRLDGFDYLGPHRYFLTFCTRARSPVFADAAIADFAITQFHRTAARHAFEYLAYCLMPDHVHLLVEGLATDAYLPRFMKSAKESSGRSYFRRAGSPLWQEGFYDRVLRREEDARGVARYILENPVRAGLVAHPLEYPFIGSDRWSVRDLLAGV